jgi:hypothetical protein
MKEKLREAYRCIKKRKKLYDIIPRPDKLCSQCTMLNECSLISFILHGAYCGTLNCDDCDSKYKCITEYDCIIKDVTKYELFSVAKEVIEEYKCIE